MCDANIDFIYTAIEAEALSLGVTIRCCHYPYVVGACVIYSVIFIYWFIYLSIARLELNYDLKNYFPED